MIEHFDVLIVGAGISGIAAAYHLQQHCPDKSFTLLERQESFGGTWVTHKFPGIRSDSDLFGYGWKPWLGPPIATAPEILKYLDEVLDEQRIREHIRFHHHIESAEWSSEAGRWPLEVSRGNSDGITCFTCDFL
jgi:cation diffusion facilitator CzcD-associated flavoprotein CzcO